MHLRLDDARLGIDGVTALDGLSFQAEGVLVAWLGDFTPLFSLLAGSAELLSGSALLDGGALSHAVARGHVGLALANPSLPKGWTVETVLEHSARLTGMTRRQARVAAADALARVGFSALTTRRFETLTTGEQRVMMLAHALIGEPSVIAAERPFSGLDGPNEGLVDSALTRASEGRSLVLSFDSSDETGMGRGWVDRADCVVCVQGGVVVASGPPAVVLGGASHFVLTVARNAAALLSALSERDLSVTDRAVDRSLLLELHSADVPASFVVGGEGADVVERIVSAAVDTEAPLLELRPALRVAGPRA